MKEWVGDIHNGARIATAPEPRPGPPGTDLDPEGHTWAAGTTLCRGHVGQLHAEWAGGAPSTKGSPGGQGTKQAS